MTATKMYAVYRIDPPAPETRGENWTRSGHDWLVTYRAINPRTGQPWQRGRFQQFPSREAAEGWARAHHPEGQLVTTWD